jgi:hypothetical protein
MRGRWRSDNERIGIQRNPKAGFASAAFFVGAGSSTVLAC